MAAIYEMQRRRQEFFAFTFDEMVERIIDQENEIENLKEEREELQDEVARLVGEN